MSQEEEKPKFDEQQINLKVKDQARDSTLCTVGTPPSRRSARSCRIHWGTPGLCVAPSSRGGHAECFAVCLGQTIVSHRLTPPCQRPSHLSRTAGKCSSG
jgi:hypothetical protein